MERVLLAVVKLLVFTAHRVLRIFVEARVHINRNFRERYASNALRAQGRHPPFLMFLFM